MAPSQSTEEGCAARVREDAESRRARWEGLSSGDAEASGARMDQRDLGMPWVTPK